MNSIDSLGIIISNCTKCILHKTRNCTVPGEGLSNSKILFVGEAPGKVNDEVGRPFVGHGGKIFDKIMNNIGISRTDVFITNTVKCWPPDNRNPKKDEISACNEYLQAQINIIQPKLIIALGRVAFTTLTGQIIKIKEDHGKFYFKDNAIVCPTFHPNGLRYVKGGMKTITDDLIGALKQIGIDTKPIDKTLYLFK